MAPHQIRVEFISPQHYLVRLVLGMNNLTQLQRYATVQVLVSCSQVSGVREVGKLKEFKTTDKAFHVRSCKLFHERIRKTRQGILPTFTSF